MNCFGWISFHKLRLFTDEDVERNHHCHARRPAPSSAATTVQWGPVRTVLTPESVQHALSACRWTPPTTPRCGGLSAERQSGPESTKKSRATGYATLTPRTPWIVAHRFISCRQPWDIPQSRPPGVICTLGPRSRVLATCRCEGVGRHFRDRLKSAAS